MLLKHARRPARTLALALMIAVAAPAASMAQTRGPDSVADLAAGLLDAVVNISTSQLIPSRNGLPDPDFPDDSPLGDLFDEQAAPLEEIQALGSGFVIDESGLIVTNNHVIDGADEIWAVFHDGSRLAATLIGYDPPTDLAVLRVEPPRPLTAVHFGDSEAVRVGDWVMAIGNPFGLGGTVTVGVLSARNRDINSGPYDDYLQTDASINRGNSGGPLFNMDGEVVGINTAIISPTGDSVGIAFSVPASMAEPVISQLIEFGTVHRARIGVRIQDMDDGLAEGFGLAQPRGALVVGFPEEDSPGLTAGMEIGDIIVNFDGHPINETRDLFRYVASTPVGTTVGAVVLRNGEEIALSVTVAARESEYVVNPANIREPVLPTGPLNAAGLGFELSEITPALRDRYDIDDDVTGVIITRIAPSSPAAERQMQVGDVIIEVGVGGDPVTTPQEVDDRLAREQGQGRGAVVLLIGNGSGNTRFEWVRIRN